MTFFFLLINIFQKTPYLFLQIKSVLIYNFTLYIIIVLNRNDNIFIMGILEYINYTTRVKVRNINFLD